MDPFFGSDPMLIQWPGHRSTQENRGHFSETMLERITLKTGSTFSQCRAANLA